MSLTSGKHEKIACATMGHHPKLKNIKNGGLREWRREKAAGAWKRNLKPWSLHPCHSYLQNCHFATQNYKNATPRPLMLTHSLC